MKKINIALGTQFGKWRVLEAAESDANGQAFYLCKCTCGIERSVMGRALRGGRTKACSNCADRPGGKPTHGASKTHTYRTWAHMKDRCFNKNHHAFASYGGRGITVCERWLKFENFLADMGDRPSLQHSIDRFPDNDGDYEPGNCRWATKSEQQKNKRWYSRPSRKKKEGWISCACCGEGKYYSPRQIERLASPYMCRPCRYGTNWNNAPKSGRVRVATRREVVA